MRSQDDGPTCKCGVEMSALECGGVTFALQFDGIAGETKGLQRMGA